MNFEQKPKKKTILTVDLRISYNESITFVMK